MDEELAAPEGADDALLNVIKEESAAQSTGEGGEDVSEEVEEIELDFAGNKKKFPKTATLADIAAELDEYTKSVWSGVTKRNQEIADQAKTLEAELSAVQKLRGMNDQLLDKYSQGRVVGAELQQLRQVNLDQLWQSNPDHARRISDRIMQVESRFNQIVNEVSHTEASLREEDARNMSQLAEKGRQAVLKEIPDFEASLPALKEYAVKRGVSQEDVENWALNPFAASAIYKAKKYDDLMAKAAKAAKPGAEAQPVKAMPTTGAASRPTVDLNRDADKISTEEWLKRRNQQLRAQK